MPMNRIQFQAGMSLSQFLELYGTEEQCEAALEQTRWPDGFRCTQCGEQEHGLVYGRRLRRYQCRSCRHQTTVTAGTIMEATKLPLTKWFQAFYLVGDAKNRYFLTLPEAKVGRKLPHCMVGAQQDYASDE